VPKKPKQHDEEHWQEIFDSIDMEFLPVEYINSIIVKFENGTVWDIDVKKSRDIKQHNSMLILVDYSTHLIFYD
jgi:hypothetical protein